MLSSAMPWYANSVDEQAKRFAPATQRNRDIIVDALRPLLPKTGTALEIASGSGEHLIYFAHAFPTITWQPSDADPEARASIAAWCAQAKPRNVLAPAALDASAAPWPAAATQADVVLCINMVHISPWASTLGLLRGAAAALPANGPLYLYGPYRRHGVVTAPSNEDFDYSLKQRDARWGLRQLEDVAAAAAEVGLVLTDVTDVPANNLSIVFRKRS